MSRATTNRAAESTTAATQAVANHLRDAARDMPQRAEQVGGAARRGSDRALKLAATGAAAVAPLVPALARQRTVRRGALFALRAHPLLSALALAGGIAAYVAGRRSTRRTPSDE